MASGAVIKAMRNQGPMKSASYEAVLDECIAVLESGVVDPKATGIQERLVKIGQLVDGLIGVTA
jgi:hypothetical protein